MSKVDMYDCLPELFDIIGAINVDCLNLPSQQKLSRAVLELTKVSKRNIEDLTIRELKEIIDNLD